MDRPRPQADRDTRRYFGYSQTRLAKAIGVRPTTSETGEANLPIEHIPNIPSVRVDVRETGFGEGKAYPARYWLALLNPLRRLALSPGQLVDRLDPPHDATILEIGPGSGYFTPRLAETVPNGQVLAVDFQRKFLEITRSRIEGEFRVGALLRALRRTTRRVVGPGGPERGEVSYIQADASAIPLTADSVDIVVLAVVLGEVPDRRACLEDVKRVLHPGGQLSLTEQRGDTDFLPRDDVVSLAEEVGFSYDETVETNRSYTVTFGVDGTASTMN